MLPEISIVVPLYNEEAGFQMLVERLNTVMESFSVPVEVVLVNDGSKDATALKMHQLALTNTRYQCVFLSRNFGHQLAVTAGLACARATAGVMVIDGDLQDPPELLHEFYENYKNGVDISYGVRKMRDDEGWLKKVTSAYFYKVQTRFSNISIPQNSGDFCFISRPALNVLNRMPEESRFIRGMRAWIGFVQKPVYFERQERVAGETKYPFRKMLKLAMNGIFNFSETPVRLITYLGIFATSVSLFYLAYTLYKKFILHVDVSSGFSGLLFAIILFSGVQLVSLGIIGEYVLRIFFQSKQRPLFVIKSRWVDGKEAVPDPENHE